MQRETVYDDVFDAQRHFRVIMDCMARPGKIGRLPEPTIHPPASLHTASALIAFSLLNADASFFASANDAASYIRMNTDAVLAPADRADFVFINGNCDASIVREVKLGSLPYPEDSATLVIDVEAIGGDSMERDMELVLKGPGIQTEHRAKVRGVRKELLIAISEINQEFPLGADMMLVDRDNTILCIPRSNKFSVN